MKRQHYLVVLAIAAVIVLAQSRAAPALSSEEGARIRVIHAVSDAPPVDVMLNSTEVFTNVGFADATDYTDASTGPYIVTLRAHSDGTPLISDSAVFTDSDYTLAAAGTSATLDLLKLLDDNSAPAVGMVRARLVHLLPGAPAVDIAIEDGPVLLSDVGFKEASDYVEIAAGTYDVEIRLAGTDMVLDTTTLAVEPNRVYTVFAIGTLDNPQFVQTVDEAYSPSCEPVEILSLTTNSPVKLGETMTFTATVDGTSPFGYGWDFDTDGTFEITPTPDTLSSSSVDVVTYTYSAVGSYTATVMVANCSVTGPYTDTQSRVVTVEAAPTNTAPSLSDLPDQTLSTNDRADNAIDLWAYADDAEDADDELTFTISNTPADGAGVIIDGNRYIDISPATDWTGETEVEIEVEDTGGLTDSDTFRVTVSGATVYLPLVIRPTPLPPPMTLYLHVRDTAPRYFLSPIKDEGTESNASTSAEDPLEWEMTLSGDIAGTEYGYDLYASIGAYQSPIVCDVEILLRGDGTDTMLASWPGAFTIPTGNDIFHFTGQTAGLDPDAANGDHLILRIRPHAGYVLMYTGEFFGQEAYSAITVPGY